MSLSKIYYDKKFSDLSITLVDRFSEEKIQVHKCILYSKNPYFGNMFGDNFQESNKSQVIIKVPNVFAAKIVIESLYDIDHIIDSDWKLQVDIYKCKDFFSQDKIFPKIKISAQEFDKFLDTIDILGYPNDIVECIIDNLPENYDLELFPTELLQSMYDLCDAYNFVNVSKRDIIISNLKTGKKIMKNELRGDYFLYYDYVPETDELIVLENDDKCLDPLIMYKINIESKKIYDIFPEKNYYIPHQVKYIFDKKVLIHYDSKIKIFDVEEKKFTNFFSQKIRAHNFSYCGYLCHNAVFDLDQIRVLDSAGNLINKYETYQVQSLHIMSKENLVIFKQNNNIKIWNYLTNEIKKIKIKSCSIQYELSSNGKHLVVILGKKIVVYDILSLEKIKILKFISKYMGILSCDFKIGGELIISCEKMLYYYDKDYNEIGSTKNNKKRYQLKLIPGKDFNLVKKIYNIIEARKLKN
ncbi:BTB family protein [Moumouvirus australiensis]|uniref:BTB family protein n=1 Tax=Moumouvirus australiensis TaxID=2109587 RepID=A0A2P1EMR4_9VIRU|nr:BTB family protein [Moumouvirus australiensis]AVL95195.1 BTB family protein [Moumouvirus australiensis]